MQTWPREQPQQAASLLTQSTSHAGPHNISTFQSCSSNSFLSSVLPFLKTASPLPVSEFVDRRNNLAKALVADGLDAFIVEPGYTFKYVPSTSPSSTPMLPLQINKSNKQQYANISQTDWEPWEPEERPFLMIIQPSIDENGNIKATTRFLCPSFEVERVRLLNMPIKDEDGDTIPWEEDWIPYKILRNSWVFGSDYPLLSDTQNRNRKPKVMVDDEIRDFIQRGLAENGFEVVGLGGEVEKVKQVKTEREIGILRAVNTGTVEAIRAVRGCLYLGLREEEVKEVLDNTLRAGGLEPFFDIVLFGTSPSSITTY
jgi:Xaa-Pro aminopeptidase